MSLALEYLALKSEVEWTTPATQKKKMLFSTFCLITCSDLRACYVLRYVILCVHNTHTNKIQVCPSCMSTVNKRKVALLINFTRWIKQVNPLKVGIHLSIKNKSSIEIVITGLGVRKCRVSPAYFHCPAAAVSNPYEVLAKPLEMAVRHGMNRSKVARTQMSCGLIRT